MKRAAIGLGMLVALTGCSQPAANAPDVAALPTTSAPASSGATNPLLAAPTTGPVTAAPSQERPRRRLDMTPAEEQQLRAPYQECLRKIDPKAADSPLAPTKPSPAMKACESLLPLPPWEMDRENPTFKDNWHKHVQCLNSKGFKVVETEPGSWTYAEGNTMPEAQRDKIEKECQRQVFGGGPR